MKKSKKLSKLIALAVLLGGNILACNSVLAENYTITIGSDGAATSVPSGGIPGVTLGESGSYIGITGGSTATGDAADAITSITTVDVISNTVWGIKTSTGTSSITFTSGTIDVYSVSGKNYGMELFEDSVSPGNATITGLQTIKAGFKSGSDSSGESIGIRAMKGVNDITFTGGTDSSIIAKSTGDSAYGIAFGVSGKAAEGTTTIRGLGSVTAETTSNISNKQTAYGICVQNKNTGSDVTFTAEFVSDGGVINAYSAKGTNYGILFGSQGDANAKSKVTNVKEIKVGVGTSGGTTSSTAYGISAKKGVNTVEFVSGSSIMAKSKGQVYGVSLEGGTNTIGTTGKELGSITAETTGSKTVYGISVTGGSNTVVFTGSDSSITAKSTGGSLSSSYAYGIQAKAGVNTVTFSGGSRSITAKSTGAGAYGINTTGGTTTIGQVNKELKSIIAETTGGTLSAKGIYAETASKTTVAFDGTGSSITVNSVGGQAFGIHTESSVSLGVTGIDSISVTSGSIAYGVCAEKGTNMVTFSGGSSSIEATSSGATTGAYGVRVKGGTNTIGTTGNALKSITVSTVGGTAGGIYATDGINTITFIGSDSSISATSSSGGAHGISVGGGKTTVSKLGGITVSSSGTKSKINLSGGTLNLNSSTVGASENVNTLSVTDSATLNLESSVISGGGSVAEGKTLTMSIDSSSKWDVDAAVTGVGAINVTNGGTLNFNADTSFNGIISGTGTTTVAATKTLTISASNLQTAITNNGTVALGAGTLADGNTITGGAINVTGAVTAGANDLASTEGITVKNGANLTLNGGTIQDAIGIENSGTGALTIAGTVANANSKTITVATLAITSGSFTTEAGKLLVTNDISNAGKLILTDTTFTALNNDLTGGGTLQIGDGTVAAQITSAKTIANAVDVKANATFENTGAISGNVTNAGTLTSSIDNLTGTITNSGTFNASGNLTKNISGTSGTTKIDGRLTANDSTIRTIAGTLALNDGTLNMQGSNTVNSITVGTLSGTGSIKFDAIIKGSATPTIDNIAVSNVAAGTILTLSNVNMTGTSTVEQWGLGSDNKKTVALVTGSDLKNLTISGTVTATSDGYKYSFTGATEKGKVDIVKDYGYSLHQIVTNYEDTSVTPTYYAGNITQYSLTDNYEATEELGELTRVSGAATRELTIDGNSHKFAGGSHQGIAVNSGDTLTLTNISEISGWNTYAVDNEGTVNIGTTGTTALKSKLQGAGKYNLTGGTLKVEDASNLAMTGADGLKNSGTVELGGDTASTLGAKITGGTLNINGNVTADASNIAADTNKVTGTLNVTSDGLNDQLAKPISGTGVVDIQGTPGSDITLGAAISVPTLNINTGTLNVQETGAISSKVTNNASLLANKGLISGEVTNKNGAFMTAAPNVITGGVKNGGSLTLNGGYSEAVALGSGITNDGDNVGSTQVLYYVSSDKNITNNLYVGGKQFTPRGFIVTPGHLSTTGTINGTINITENSSLDLNSAYSNATAIDNDGTLNVTAANLGAAVDNAGTVNLGVGELTEVITGGTLNINDNVMTVADNIASDTNLVAETKTLTLTAGTLSKDVTNSGTIKTTGDVTISSKLNGGTVGKLVVESGKLIYSNTTAGSITNNVEIKAGASMDPDAGVFATGTRVTNYGNLEITGGNLAASVTNYSTGNLEITEPVTVVEGGNLTFENGSTLKLEAEKYFAATESAATADKAAIQGINSATNITIDNGAKLALTGEIENGGYYVVLGGTAVSGLDAWQGLKLKELFPDDDAVTAYEVVKANGALSILFIKTTKAEENINCFAGVQQGMISVNNQVADAVADHLGLVGKGRAKDGYKKDVWASYIRNKDDVKGMATSSNQGSFGSDYRAQVNGTTVGADLFTSKKAIGGIAINYATGDTHGTGAGVGNAIAHINNKTKYYGVELYNRITNNHHAILMDIGYMHGNNEISVAEAKNWTGDADVNSITAGLRWERDIQLKGSKLIPFAGVRYIRLQSKDFTNTKGMAYSTNSQNLVQPKVGLGWTGEYYMSQSDWTFKPRIEIGYLWALGNREAETNAFVNKYFVTNKFDVTDKNSYYAKLGMDFMCRNFVAGIGYSYMKGDAVRGNRWNINLDYSF